MADRNLSTYFRGGRFSTREGMILELPPSGFDWGGNVRPVEDPFTTNETVQKYPLGSKLIYGERWFRYSKAGATALVAGNVLQSSVFEAQHLTRALDVPAIGATVVNVTLGTVAVVADEYQDGYFIQDAGATGAGYLYRIKSHPVIALSTAGNFTLVDPIVVAIPAAGTGSLLRSPYRGVLQAVVTTPTAHITGVAQSVITGASFGWIQTHGPASVLTEGTVLVQNPVTGTTGTAGAVGPITVADVLKETIVGFVLSVGADDTWSTIFLTIE